MGVDKLVEIDRQMSAKKWGPQRSDTKGKFGGKCELYHRAILLIH